jgi:death-on-curing protein
VTSEPEWLESEAILALHSLTIARHGGLDGVRDLGALEAALQRPRNRFLYEDVTDVVELAATYADALSGAHPFTDGNKRAAFQGAALFLRLNGFRLRASQADAARVFLALAAGEITRDQLAAWLRENAAPTPPPAAV